MNITELIALKVSKLSDISEIDKLIEIEENREYDEYIGKFYQISSTSITRVDKIDYVDDYNINFTGLHVMGGAEYTDEFRIHISDSNHLSRNGSNHEITKEQFISIMEKWKLEHTKYIMAKLDK